MENDDLPVGRVLNRRELLAILGITAPILATGYGDDAAATETNTGNLPACVVRPQQTLGPYFVDEGLNRGDIRSDPGTGVAKTGAALALTFNVSRISSGACTPVAGAQVDVWHCDAAGVYSDVNDPRFNTVGQKFLRGYQVTDAAGRVAFTTIYPGWYQGRAVHIHFKIRTTAGASSGFEFVSQLYFDDSLTDQVFTQSPYSARGQRTTRNSNDGIFRSGGTQLVLATNAVANGYAASFDIGLQL